MADWSPKPHLFKGLLILAIGFGGFVAWALLFEIRGAVVAAGEVAVEARRQAIQHRDGGLVAALHVKEGQAVTAGTPILTLDGTEIEAERAVALRERAEIMAQMDRLMAEVKNDERISFGPTLLNIASGVPDLARIMAEEEALFEARRTTLHQTIAQLDERTRQTNAVIDGHAKQLAAERVQIALIKQELAAQQKLLSQGLTEKTRVLALQREAAKFEGEIGQLEANIAEARSSIAGFQVERLRLEAEFREKAQTELRTLQPKEAELGERLRVLDTRQARLVLRAPMSGAILGLQAHTVGGVIAAGAEVAAIIPSGTALILTVDIDPRQIDRVHAGQGASIRFPNFDARTTPEVEGIVTSVSADAITEANTGRHYFRAELALSPDARAKLGNRELLAGMPVEAFIQTDARTPASFLLKPLADYWAYAMREE